jgi:hypothetical protein
MLLGFMMFLGLKFSLLQFLQRCLAEFMARVLVGLQPCIHVTRIYTMPPFSNGCNCDLKINTEGMRWDGGSVGCIEEVGGLPDEDRQ